MLSRAKKQNGNRYGGERRTLKPKSPKVGLERAMQGWGIDSRKGPKHEAFWNDNKEFLDKVMDGEVTRQPRDILLLLPEDPVDAMRDVCEQELRNHCQDEGLMEITDLLLVQVKKEHAELEYIPLPSYKFDYVSYCYEMNPAIAKLGVSESQLCPFDRFCFERVPGKDKFKRDLLDNGHHRHIGYRAIVAHHACHEAECAHCDSQSLRWNGYDYDGEIESRPWKKLVCADCGSVYEIKSGPSVETILSKLERGFYDGGSFFDAFYAVKKELPSDAKQFVAVISTEQLDSGDWPVFVAEVQSVVPLLKDKSFRLDEGCRVYSRMALKIGSGRKWFKAPSFDFDSYSIAEAVIDAL